MPFFGEDNFEGPGAFTMTTADTELHTASEAASDKAVLPMIPGETMTKVVREEWVRKAKRALTTEQETVRSGGVPAKLKAETWRVSEGGEARTCADVHRLV